MRSRLATHHIARWILLVTVLIVAVHYILFVDSINKDRECKGQYNERVLISVKESQDLLREANAVQNNKVDSIVIAFLQGAENEEPGDVEVRAIRVKAALERSSERQMDLGKRLDAISIPEIPKCFD